LPSSNFFVCSGNIVFVENLMIRIQSQKSFHTPFDVREMFFIKGEVTNITLL
jgi:hypothetical protein